jgi:hypothetical protein
MIDKLREGEHCLLRTKIGLTKVIRSNMNGNNKEETRVLAATSPHASAGSPCHVSVDGKVLTAVDVETVETALPRLGVAVGLSSYDCPVCSKRHKVFRPSRTVFHPKSDNSLKSIPTGGLKLC